MAYIPDFHFLATKVDNMKDFEKDPMKGPPSGITIHVTADGGKDQALAALKAEGLGYHFIIDRDGSILQLCRMTQITWHAGNALWEGHSPNRQHIAISLVSWGVLDEKAGKFYSWSKKEIPANEVIKAKGNVNQNIYPWHAATDKQNKSLDNLCYTLIDMGIPASGVCGHDECSVPVGRKSDPGGVVPMSMAKYREYLKAYSRGKNIFQGA